MSGESPFTIVGNLTADPELKFTQGGVPMARFTIASTPRTYDKNTGQWVDGTALFMRCTAWREMAEHVAETLTRGMRVIATGNLTQHNWKTDQGENRSMLGLDVQEVGPSLRFATAKVTRAQRANGGAADGGRAADPWSTATPGLAPAAAPMSGGFAEEPPF
ncbi:single-stranded DNA-binding protein [Kitasatospora kifunensis]|uniref:Single-stranded DNA-binding protein n=1 Tax=Kitasatospora kifunensis TaxID=58351 RepID=A0A7W7R3Y1_KITKI|nr:single-stranded DNA-binding protein [Kitasatospora kifunensis]MBB4924785.1 single-strand DNA-binding protein [Kitasatospora kifunensis]